MSDLWARHITIWNDTEKISMAPCARMTRITWVDTPIWGSFFFSQTTKYYTTWLHLDHPSIPSRKLPEVVDIYPYLHPLFYLDMHHFIFETWREKHPLPVSFNRIFTILFLTILFLSVWSWLYARMVYFTWCDWVPWLDSSWVLEKLGQNSGENVEKLGIIVQ